MNSDEKRIAVLIDADNVSADYIGPIFDEVSNHGAPIMKRIYGDWTKPSLGKWKPLLLEYSIIPIQQYSYTSGKNATDSALIIDAMDILYSQSIDGFCIVSSDSDFTRLASRLREAGKSVIGMGEKKTPSAFVNACEQFKYLEVLADSGKDEPQEAAEEDTAKPSTKSPGPTRAVLSKAIGSIIDDVSDGDGWAPLGAVGQRLNTRYPAFDSRNYGFKKLSLLVDSFPRFEVVSRTLPSQHEAQTFIRLKETKKRSATVRKTAAVAVEDSVAQVPSKDAAAEKKTATRRTAAKDPAASAEPAVQKKPVSRRTTKTAAAMDLPVAIVEELPETAPKKATTRRTTRKATPEEESLPPISVIRRPSSRRTTAPRVVARAAAKKTT